jgi:hypothetical protein
LELSQTLLNRHLARNLALLGCVQYQLLSVQQQVGHRHSPLPTKDFWEEAQQYMRYTTAVYGQAMIHAAQVDAQGRLDGKIGQVTLEAISKHIGIPQEDIVLMDVDYNGDCNHLQHFVAINHAHQKVVLSIRGTFSLSEIIVDVAGFSRDFCGGEGHSEMVTMAERVWAVAGSTVTKLLQQHANYELIVTGHSLGAGTACLLTILLQSSQQGILLPDHNKMNMRCFAYAAPPVFYPLQLVPKAVQSTTNFVHQNDVVPFLSVDSVRHLSSSLRAVEDYASEQMSRIERMQVLLGMKAPPSGLIDAVLQGPSVEPKRGAPPLEVPAGRTLWIKEATAATHACDGDDYTFEWLDPNSFRLQQQAGGGGIRVHPDMFVDHFPPRYEHAFDRLAGVVDHLPGEQASSKQM